MSKNICDNQDDFNQAVDKALTYSATKSIGNGIGVTIYLILHLVFLFWGVMLASKQPKKDRTIHLVLAIVFAPAYVIAHYLNNS